MITIFNDVLFLFSLFIFISRDTHDNEWESMNWKYYNYCYETEVKQMLRKIIKWYCDAVTYDNNDWW